MTYPHLEPREAHAQLVRFRILDVREVHEFNGPLGRIVGAESVPLGSLPGALETSSRSDTLLLVCRSGMRSAKACEILLEQGFDDVTNLAGGMIGWNRGTLPVARQAAQDHAQLLESLVAWMAHVTATPRPDVEATIGAYLGESGTSLESPTTTSIDHALQRVSQSLQAGNPPADLDLVLEALHKDLALL
jgi:rhodanese-related sulfurtransferase